MLTGVRAIRRKKMSGKEGKGKTGAHAGPPKYK